MRYVSVAGTQIAMSHNGANIPPSFPVRAMVLRPHFFATCAAWQTFFAFPDVLRPMNTSLDLPSAHTNCEKTSSGETSLEKAVDSDKKPVKGIAGMAFCNFDATSSGRFARSFSLRGRLLQKPFKSSPAQCSESAALPPLPHNKSLP